MLGSSGVEITAARTSGSAFTYDTVVPFFMEKVEDQNWHQEFLKYEEGEVSKFRSIAGRTIVRKYHEEFLHKHFVWQNRSDLSKAFLDTLYEVTVRIMKMIELKVLRKQRIEAAADLVQGRMKTSHAEIKLKLLCKEPTLAPEVLAVEAWRAFGKIGNRVPELPGMNEEHARIVGQLQEEIRELVSAFWHKI